MEKAVEAFWSAVAANMPAIVTLILALLAALVAKAKMLASAADAHAATLPMPESTLGVGKAQAQINAEAVADHLAGTVIGAMSTPSTRAKAAVRAVAKAIENAAT